MRARSPVNLGPSLFEYDFSAPSPTTPLSPGDLVCQRVAIVGLVDVVFPYWQVLARHGDSTPQRPLWLCRAVPVSEYPGQITVFETRDIERLDRRWRVPSHAEVEGWLSEAWGLNTFTVRLNFQPDGTIFTCASQWQRGGARGTVVRRSERLAHGLYVKYPPLEGEAELLALMQDLPWTCGHFTRSSTPATLAQERRCPVPRKEP